mgnify:CR=1 FL=1
MGLHFEHFRRIALILVWYSLYRYQIFSSNYLYWSLLHPIFLSGHFLNKMNENWKNIRKILIFLWNDFSDPDPDPVKILIPGPGPGPGENKKLGPGPYPHPTGSCPTGSSHLPKLISIDTVFRALSEYVIEWEKKVVLFYRKPIYWGKTVFFNQFFVGFMSSFHQDIWNFIFLKIFSMFMESRNIIMRQIHIFNSCSFLFHGISGL